MAEQRLRVVVDKHRCIGAGNCIAIAPTAFKWKNDEPIKAEVLDPESVDEEILREAELTCPTYAIFVQATGEDPTA